MGEIARDARERAFIAQEQLFVAEALKALRLETLEDVADVTARPPVPLRPVLINDYRRLSRSEVDGIAEAYWGEHGVAHFIVLDRAAEESASHPLLEIAKQLSDTLPLKFPVTHPMEGHPEAVSRFGPSDGTLKIYDLEARDGSTGYREQAETAEMFDAHNDGLGYAGAVEAFALYADSVPLWGGYTYFQNVIQLSLILAKRDPEAFTSLFLPDAITALRPRGKGAIEVTTPVLFVNEHGRPQVFFRVSTGEYRMTWRAGCPPLDRASSFLHLHTRPFAPGSTFVHLDRPGAACVARNHSVVHGRTPFINGRDPTQRRVLARKWFMSAPEHAKYKHVPGIHILESFASIYPERFGPDRLVGDWNYDSNVGANIRKA